MNEQVSQLPQRTPLPTTPEMAEVVPLYEVAQMGMTEEAVLTSGRPHKYDSEMSPAEQAEQNINTLEDMESYINEWALAEKKGDIDTSSAIQDVLQELIIQEQEAGLIDEEHVSSIIDAMQSQMEQRLSRLRQADQNKALVRAGREMRRTRRHGYSRKVA